MRVRLLIVDDHDVVRQGVRSILRTRSEWEVCGEAGDGVEALQKIADLHPDVVVLDLSMPQKDGLAVATELSRMKSSCKVVVLTMHDSTEVESAIRRAGAHGYVIKSQAAKDLIKAIETILNGELFFSTEAVAGRA